MWHLPAASWGKQGFMWAQRGKSPGSLIHTTAQLQPGAGTGLSPEDLKELLGPRTDGHVHICDSLSAL